MQELARWVATATDIPADVRERVRLQQLLAQARARVDREAPVDHLFWAHVGHGSPALWAEARTFGELLRATAVANEVCGRVALSHLLAPRDLDLGGLFARVGVASLRREEPDLSDLSLGPVAVDGGIGRVWLTRCLGLALTPVHLQQRVAVEAVAELLRRHRVAADKPLRPDQWRRCTVRVPTWTQLAEQQGDGSLERSIARSVGVLAVEQELCDAAWDPAWWLGAKGEAAQAVSACVEVVHEPSFSVEVLEHAARSGLVDRAELVTAALELPPPEGPRGWLELLRAGAHKLLGARAGSLEAFDPTAFRTVLPVEIELETVRGGVWAERRHLPEGSPGWFPEDTTRRVEALFGEEPSDWPDGTPLPC